MVMATAEAQMEPLKAQHFSPVIIREDIAQFLNYFLNFVHVTLTLHIDETYILTSSVIF